MILFLPIFLFTNCKKDNNKQTSFRIDFNDNQNQNSLKKQYQSNSKHEWKIKNKKIECLVSRKNRSVILLDRLLSKDIGNLDMSLNIGFFNKKISKENKNWAGFSIGQKDYSSENISKIEPEHGLNLGISTNGALFIGKPTLNHKNQIIINKLFNGIILHVKITPIESKYTIDLTAKDIETEKMLASISKNNISNEQLKGNISLVSNFVDTNNKNSDSKSVWFSSWEIKGNKLSKNN
ncbi:hypothetical protein [Lutibacter sp. Hel_I_33_5]|uniref:hypothetical protein n=1 Tax=Lutibacter sp. Hel_I_33_5 TaxID=1566289 RepID=UPI0011AA6C24|nr:hypothetical protein [Lutibacter sp. Hel_I_33_5]